MEVSIFFDVTFSGLASVLISFVGLYCFSLFLNSGVPDFAVSGCMAGVWACNSFM